MLIVFALLYFSRHLINAAPTPIIPIDANSPIVLPTCLCPSTRTVWNIAWSCIVTIFACTWASMHPNIPASNEGWIKNNLRRIEMMLWALVAPELVINWAVRQWIGARRLQRTFSGGCLSAYSFNTQLKQCAKSWSPSNGRTRMGTSSKWVDSC